MNTTTMQLGTMQFGTMQLGYNTNGLAHHSLEDAIALVAGIGYQSIAITLDHTALNPYHADLSMNILVVRELLEQHELSCVIETGARYLLNPRIKHEPTLVSPKAKDRARRVDFLQYAVDIAVELDAECVSLWSGVVHDDAEEGEAMERLVDGLQEVVAYAGSKNVALGFEPEPGMLIDTMDNFEKLLDRVDELQLTLDLGHLHCQDEVPIAAQIDRWAKRIVNVHIEDMRRGVHEHLMFGDGEMEFPPILAALAGAGYCGPVQVELSRHSHDGPNAARQAYDFLQPLISTTVSTTVSTTADRSSAL